MPDILNPRTDIRVRLKKAISAFKGGDNIFIHHVASGKKEESYFILSRWDSFPEDSFQVVADAYAALTPNFPRTRLLTKAADKEFVRTLVTYEYDPDLHGEVDGRANGIHMASYLYDGKVRLGAYAAYERINCYYLMELMKGLKPFESLAEDREDRRLLDLRHRPECFQDLGRMLVLDLFFSNNDRLLLNNDDELERDKDFDARSRLHWHDDGRWILLPRNVFWFGDHRTGSFNATDFLAPNNEFRSLTQTLEQQYAKPEGERSFCKNWPGNYLRPTAWGSTSRRMAREIISFLNDYLECKGNPVRFNNNCVFMLHQGLEEGWTNLRKYCQREKRRKGGRLAVGMKSRMKRLGW